MIPNITFRSHRRHIRLNFFTILAKTGNKAAQDWISEPYQALKHPKPGQPISQRNTKFHDAFKKSNRW